MVVAATPDDPDPSDTVLEAARAVFVSLDCLTGWKVQNAGGTELLGDEYGYGHIVLGSQVEVQEVG